MTKIPPAVYNNAVQEGEKTMMNKSSTEYCDFTFNPVTGCLWHCEYCHTLKMLRLLSSDVRINKGSPQLTRITKDLYILPKPFHNECGSTNHAPAGTTPTLHEYRLPMISQKKKPANILVCSMGELFGDWIPEEWICRIFEACKAAPQHNYLFLTKNPQRYRELANAGKLPALDNFWYGSTVTKNDDRFFGDENYNTFISAEPLLGELDVSAEPYKNAQWIILGAETGTRRGKVKPEQRWMRKIEGDCRKFGIPLFMRDNVETKAVWKEQIIQELPLQLYREPDVPVPRCHECSFAIWKQDGKRGQVCFCTFDNHKNRPQHIKGRYTRTSPPWCELRKPEIFWEHSGNKKSNKQGISRRVEIIEINTQGEKEMKLTQDKAKPQSGNDCITQKVP